MSRGRPAEPRWRGSLAVTLEVSAPTELTALDRIGVLAAELELRLAAEGPTRNGLRPFVGRLGRLPGRPALAGVGRLPVLSERPIA